MHNYRSIRKSWNRTNPSPALIRRFLYRESCRLSHLIRLLMVIPSIPFSFPSTTIKPKSKVSDQRSTTKVQRSKINYQSSKIKDHNTPWARTNWEGVAPRRSSLKCIFLVSRPSLSFSCFTHPSPLQLLRLFDSSSWAKIPTISHNTRRPAVSPSVHQQVHIAASILRRSGRL